MSNKAMAWARKVINISAAEKAVLMAIADYYQPVKAAYPGKGTLETTTCLSKRHIGRVIWSLDAKGLIWIQAWKNSYGQGSSQNLSNRYFLPFVDPELAAKAKQQGRTVYADPVWDYETKRTLFESEFDYED